LYKISPLHTFVIGLKH